MATQIPPTTPRVGREEVEHDIEILARVLAYSDRLTSLQRVLAYLAQVEDENDALRVALDDAARSSDELAEYEEAMRARIAELDEEVTRLRGLLANRDG